MRRIFLRNLSALDEYGSGSHANFPIQFSESADTLLVRALAPGIRQDDLDIVVSGQTLSISGRIACKNGRYLRQESHCGVFRREIDLGCLVDGAKTRAALKDGVLAITLPKHQSARPRRIKVEYGA